MSARPTSRAGDASTRRSRRCAAGARPVAGGTDLVVGARQGKAPLPEQPRRDPPARRAARHRAAGRRRCALGALVDPRARSSADPRRSASATPRSPTPRRSSARTRRAHTGTIGGNVMNASPAMETGGPLICLGATVTLRSAAGERAGRGRPSCSPGPGTTGAAAGRAADRRSSCRRPPRAPAAATSGSSTAGRWRSRSSARPPSVTLDGGDGRRARASRSRRSRRPSGACPRRRSGARRLRRRRRRRRGGRAAAAAAAAADLRRPRARPTTAARWPRSIARRAIEAAVARARGETVPIPASPPLHAAASSEGSA